MRSRAATRLLPDGTWRSLVARLLWEQEAPGSNPGVPIEWSPPASDMVGAMNMRDRFMKWWKPAQWEEDHPEERAKERNPEGAPEELVHGVLPMGGATYDRVDVERDLRKP
jgi:hypothetical protein